MKTFWVKHIGDLLVMIEDENKEFRLYNLRWDMDPPFSYYRYIKRLIYIKKEEIDYLLQGIKKN